MREALSLFDETERRDIRTRIRKQRRQTSADDSAAADRAIRINLSALGAYRRANRIAIYFAFDGEPDLHELLASESMRGKSIYAPVIHGNVMRFAGVAGTDDLKRNSFGILEPTDTEYIDVRFLDLVLTPLVAFDKKGARIGVGGGFYDRCFRFLAHRRTWFKPRLVGIAHSFQEIQSIHTAAWDVPLWGVVTEDSSRVFDRA